MSQKAQKPFCHDSSLAWKVNKSKLKHASKCKKTANLQDSMLQMLHKIKITSLKWGFQHASHIASNKIHNKIKNLIKQKQLQKSQKEPPIWLRFSLRCYKQKMLNLLHLDSVSIQNAKELPSNVSGNSFFKWYFNALLSSHSKQPYFHRHHSASLAEYDALLQLTSSPSKACF